MSFTIRKLDDLLIVKLQDRAAIEMADDLKKQLLSEIEHGYVRVIVELKQVEMVDSTFLGVLVTALKRCTAGGGELTIAGIRQPVLTMFELTRLNRIFQILDTTEDAISHLKASVQE